MGMHAGAAMEVGALRRQSWGARRWTHAGDAMEVGALRRQSWGGGHGDACRGCHGSREPGRRKWNQIL